MSKGRGFTRLRWIPYAVNRISAQNKQYFLTYIHVLLYKMEINSNLNIRFILSCKHFSGEVQYYMFENLKSQISKLFLP